jgi:histidyl-tRNA synthetase
MQKPSIPKGTRDFSPEEMAKRNYIFNTIREVFHLYGFQQIDSCHGKPFYIDGEIW